MAKRLTVTTLARQAGVTSKAIRYWESLGLLPRASRTHTGYRVFPPEAEAYVQFVRKSKAIGLSLREMREVLRLARAGTCPCEDVVRWTEARTREIESEIRTLSETLARLKRALRAWRKTAACAPEDCGVDCTLIEHLPEFQSDSGGKADEQMVEVCSRNDPCRGTRGAAGDGACGGDVLSAVPALSLRPLARRRSRN